jgi:L-asparagine transporter-like permease
MTPGPEKKLTRRHVEFLAIGGTIGAGLFLGSGTGIQRGGPSLIIAYLLAGAVVFIIARCLAEMALEDPGRGTFVSYVERYLGASAAFVSGWSYWFATVLAGMAELTGLGTLWHAWTPAMPEWVPAFAGLLCLYLINRSNVRAFGEVEFWMALLKIMALLAFIALGTAVLLIPLGIRPPTASLTNLWMRGGVFPQGIRGFFGVLPVALFGFGGVELIGLAAAETQDAARTLPRAANGLILRLFIFYVGSMLIIMSIMPWTAFSPGASPFVLVLQSLGIPVVATLMNILLISVLLSSCNSLLFGAARVLSSLAVAGAAPASLGTRDASGVPARAARVSTAAISATILLDYFIPARALGLLLSAAVVVLIVNWVLFVLAHFQFRRRLTEARPTFRPVVPTWLNFAVVAFVAIVIGVLACDAQFCAALIFCMVFFAVLGVAAWRYVGKARSLRSAGMPS